MVVECVRMSKQKLKFSFKILSFFIFSFLSHTVPAWTFASLYSSLLQSWFSEERDPRKYFILWWRVMRPKVLSLFYFTVLILITGCVQVWAFAKVKYCFIPQLIGIQAWTRSDKLKRSVKQALTKCLWISLRLLWIKFICYDDLLCCNTDGSIAVSLFLRWNPVSQRQCFARG